MTAPAPSQAPRQPRIAQLDAVRGIAVIGIAWMNVYVFALPAQAYYNPAVWGLESAVDRIVWAASFIFIEDKFRTLFAMLFGAGCLILWEKSEDRRWRAHVARMAVLFVIGLAHSVFLASNDVLRAYALAGLAIPFLAGLSSSALYAIAIGFTALHVGAGIVMFGSGILDFFTGKTETDALLFVQRNFGNDAAAVQYSLGLGTEGFAERVVRRIGNIPAQLRVVAGSVPLNLAAMALGMALWRDRMWAGEWRTFRLQRLAAVCALLSIPALLVCANWVAEAGFPGALVGPAALVISAPFDMLLGLAYALLFMAFLSPAGPVTWLLSSVGRLSLTNYIATSLILAGLFASWGLGWFGEVSRAQAFGLSFVPIVLMLVWSPIWVRRFGQGPLERLWRSAARLMS